MPQLICRDLSIGYEDKPVASAISFTVQAGDYLCIVGENGSGKSTLLKTILKLKAPLSGQIKLGDDVSPVEIGYLPQQTMTQKDFPASVQEVVRSGCLNRCGWRPFYNKAEKQLADDNLKKLGISALAKRCYRELSGGQQQRVLLARALCAARKLLLLDEPAAGLDPKAADKMYSLIKKLNDGGLTIIMVSHDIGASVKYASHILHLGAQSPLFCGTAAGYLKNKIGRAYAGLKGRTG